MCACGEQSPIKRGSINNYIPVYITHFQRLVFQKYNFELYNLYGRRPNGFFVYWRVKHFNLQKGEDEGNSEADAVKKRRASR